MESGKLEGYTPRILFNTVWWQYFGLMGRQEQRWRFSNDDKGNITSHVCRRCINKNKTKIVLKKTILVKTKIFKESWPGVLLLFLNFTFPNVQFTCVLLVLSIWEWFIILRWIMVQHIKNGTTYHQFHYEKYRF